MVISELKKYFIRFSTPAMLIALALLLSLTVSCGGGGGSLSSDSTAVTINLGQRERIARDFSIQALPAPVIPDSVASVVIKVTGPSMTPIMRIINIYDFTVLNELIPVPSGRDRLFEVIAFDETDGNGILLFKGNVSANLTGTPVSLTVIMQSTDYDNILSQGFYELAEMQDIPAAKKYFKDAAYLSGNSRSNQADTARFLYALTRVFSLFLETGSDGNPSNGINTSGEIADLFDCTVSGLYPLDPILFDVVCPQLMPADSPAGGQLQGYLYDVVRPELIGAIEGFNQISDTFNVNWYEPFGVTYVESDYGDVLTLRAAAKSLLSQILMQQAHNLNVDIDAQEGSGKTIQQFLSENPAFLSLTNPAHLVTAKSYLTGSALDDSVAAINWILAETDDQSNDFINIDIGIDPGQITMDDINKAKEHIAKVKECLDGQCTTDDNGTPGMLTDDTIMNLSRLYSGEVNYRNLMPSFAGEIPQGFLPDPSLGGVIVKVKGNGPSIINEDMNANLTADIFENDIYYVYGGNVPFPIDLMHPEDSGYQFLGARNSSNSPGAFNGDYDYYLIKNFGGSVIHKHYDVKLDAVQLFTGATDHGYCCTEVSLWSTALFWDSFMYGPDFDVFYMYGDDFILMEAYPYSVNSIKVYTLP